MRFIARQVLSVVLWLLSSAAAFGLYVAVDGALRTLTSLVIRINPLHPTSSFYQGVAVERAISIGLLLVWLVAAIYLLSYYLQGAAEGLLGKRFLRVMLIQIAVLTVAYGIPLLIIALAR